MNKYFLPTIYEQTLIACRAFFPDSMESLHGIMCYKDGQPLTFVEINYVRDGSIITYDVWRFPYRDYRCKFNTAYSVSYDKMRSILKYLSHNA